MKPYTSPVFRRLGGPMPRKNIGRFASLYAAVAAVAAVLIACSTPSSAPVPEPTPPTVSISAPPTSASGRRAARPGAVAKPPVVDTRSDVEKANAACRGFDGSWHCSMPQPHLMAVANGTAGNCGPVCGVTAWYLDPANSTGCAADTNSGTQATCGAAGSGLGPVLTMAQLVSRYGTPTPKINNGLTLTVTWLSSQTINTDVFRFDPLVTGSGNFVELGGATGTGTKVGGTFLVSTGGGSITAKVQTSSGAPLKLVFSALPAGIAVGQIIQDVTRSSWATVYKIATLTVSVTQPLANAGLTTVSPAPSLAEDNGWTAGDTYQLWQPISLNLKGIQPQGGDSNLAFTAGVAWYQGIHIFDSSGSPGNSTVGFGAAGVPIVFSLDVFDPFMSASGFNNAGAVQFASCQGNGGLLNDAQWSAGATNISVADGMVIQSNVEIDGDCIVDGNVLSIAGRNTIPSALIDGAITVEGSVVVNSPSASGASQLVYGPGTINLIGGGAYRLGASNFTNALKVATIELDSATVFDTYLPSSGTWVNHAGPFTSANIDTGGGAGGAGVQNARTGSRYSPVN